MLALVSLATAVQNDDVTDAAARPTSSARARNEATEDAGSAAALALVKGEKMNLNTASRRELELLPGIGPALASRIVSFRETNGAFNSVEELTRVRGIGPKTLQRVKSMLTVSGESD